VSQQIDKHFIEVFQQELFVAFQNKGGIIRPRSRRKTGVVGTGVYFPKIGTAPAALPKTRHGKVPLLEIARDRVKCELQDFYGADLIDDMDELKTNVNERTATQDALVFSLNRTEDDLGLAALNTGDNSANSLGADDTWTSDAVPRAVLEAFGEQEMIEGGNMHALISWKAWNALLAINSFVNADFGGDTALTSEGQKPKNYFGFAYAPYSRLPLTSGARTNLFFNSRVLGVAVGKEITPVTERLAQYDADQVMAKMSMGAVLIESKGVIRRRYAS
jgi:hypothetical protein